MSIQNDPTPTTPATSTERAPTATVYPTTGTMTAERTASSGGRGGDHGAKEAVGEVGNQAKALAGQARDQAMDLMDRTRQEVRQQAESRGQQMAGTMRTWVQQLSALAEGRPQEAGQMQQYLQDARMRLTSWADRLEQKGPDGLLQDVTRFARRRPGMFLALSAGTGFALGRMVRSGASAQKEHQQGGNGRYAMGGAQFEYQPPRYPDGGGSRPLDDGTQTGSMVTEGDGEVWT